MSDPVELGGGMLRTGEAATLAWLNQMVAIALEGYAVSRPPAAMPAHSRPNGYWDVDSDVVLAQTTGKRGEWDQVRPARHVARRAAPATLI